MFLETTMGMTMIDVALKTAPTMMRMTMYKMKLVNEVQSKQFLLLCGV